MKQGGLQGALLTEGTGQGWRLLREQPGALKDGNADTTLAKGTWRNTKKGGFFSQRDWMGSLPADKKGTQAVLEYSFFTYPAESCHAEEIYGILLGLCPPV